MLVQLFFSYIYRCRGELEVHLASHRYADGASPLHMAAMSLGVESTGAAFRMFSSVFGDDLKHNGLVQGKIYRNP